MADTGSVQPSQQREVAAAASNAGNFQWQALLFAGAVIAGIASLLQTTFNTGMAKLLNEHALDHPKSDIVAANVSFTFSTALLCLITGISAMISASSNEEAANQPAPKARDDSPALVYFSYATAGLLGATHIVLKVITSPILGLGLDYLFVVLGQLVSSLFIDWLGLLGVKQVSLNWKRFVAIGLALVGAALVTLSAADYTNAHSVPLVIGAAVLASIAGSLHPVQAATMQVLNARHPNPWIVALISFSGGLVWLTVVSGVSIGLDLSDGELQEGWLGDIYGDLRVFDVLGGAMGVGFIALTVMITPLLGMNTFYIVSVFGQLFAAVLVDAAPAADWKHALPVINASVLRVVGVSTSLLGIAVLVLPLPFTGSDESGYDRIE